MTTRLQARIERQRLAAEDAIGSPEACERAIDRLTAGLVAPDHAEVLAKALDQFLRDAWEPASAIGVKVAQLRAEVEPTLQALGYPKDEK